MRSASACVGSLCARACYVRARACARSSHACANEISMRVGSRDCLKGFRKKSRGEIKPRLNGLDHPIQSITFCSRHHTDKFTVFPSFFRSIFFYCFHFFLRVSTAESEKERFFIAHDHCMKIRLGFPLFFRASEICPPQDKSKAPSLHFSSFSARFSSYSTS